MKSPDIELLVTQYLRGRPALAGVAVGRTYGGRIPAVSVRRVGGRNTPLVDYPALSVNVWAATDKAVNDLAAAVVTELENYDTRPVQYLRPTGPADIPSDVTGAVARYIGVSSAVRRQPA